MQAPPIRRHHHRPYQPSQNIKLFLRNISNFVFQTHLMNLLSNRQALEHDESVGQQDKSPNPNFVVRQDGIGADRDSGLAA